MSFYSNWEKTVNNKLFSWYFIHAAIWFMISTHTNVRCDFNKKKLQKQIKNSSIKICRQDDWQCSDDADMNIRHKMWMMSKNKYLNRFLRTHILKFISME